MMTPVAAGGPRPSAASRAALLAAPVASSQPARIRRAKASGAPRRKAAHIRKAVHAGKAPVRRKLARTRASEPSAAPIVVGVPDARLMMTRLAPPATTPRYAEITTTVCTEGSGPEAHPILPADLLPDGIAPRPSLPPGILPPEDELVIYPPLGPPDEPDLELVPTVSPPLPPILPPTEEPLQPPLPPTTAVPEPGAWALMILGFGLLGGALRRRRAHAA